MHLIIIFILANDISDTSRGVVLGLSWSAPLYAPHTWLMMALRIRITRSS
jgi:hypothetical protein